jgi:outer membrane autotransporter protein
MQTGRIGDSSGLESLDSRRAVNDRLTTVILALFAGLCLGTIAAHPQDATWEPSSAPGTSDWNTPGNWTPGSVPTGTATFANSGLTNITVSGFVTVETLQFNAGAPAYTFSINGRNVFLFIQAGIVNLSSNSPTFTASNRSDLLFRNASIAGNATISVSDGASFVLQESSAGNATISVGNNGQLIFEDASTAGQARLITDAGGITDISFNSSGGMAAGSIEGAGTYQLGSEALTVGLNNLSTEVSGTIEDGDTAVGGSLIKVGTGTLTLSGVNTYSAGTTISSGTLQIGDGVTNGSIIGDVLDNATLAFDPAGSATFSSVISGTGNLLKVGSGTVILTANNSYSGGTNFDGGILAVSSDANLGTGALSFDGGTLEALATEGGIISSKGIKLNALGGTFLADSGTTSALSGAITGAGAFTKDGAGILVLSGASTYSGGTTVSGGILQAGSSTAFSPNSAFTVNSVLNLAGFSNTVGSLAGSGTVTNNGSPAILTAGGNGTSTVFSGTLINGTASLGLIKTGLGTLTLSGANTYTGGTTITGGTLQIGNAGTTGSIVGNVLDNGSLVFNRSDAITFPGIISGPGSLTQNGSGSLTLTAANTYSGGTVIDHGTLLVNNAQALGTGNVTVNGGVLAADPQPINVKGNYTQNAGGTLQLNVAGGNPGQYDTLNVGGNAALGGTLKLISLGFQPKAGDTLTLVTTGGVVSGRFAQFIDPFTAGPGFTIAGLVYEPNAVLLEFRTAASFALTPNQLAAGRLLDAVHQDPRAANLISFFNTEPFANLPDDLEKISPDGLTSLYEISFSNANIQKLNLESRLDDIHNGSSGFSSNMKVNGATVNLENRADADGKSSKAVVEPILQPGPQNRWGVWVTGFGDFVNVDGDGNAQGYNFTTGGVSLGIDYRITDQLAIGAFGEYSHTWTDLNPGGHIDVDSGRGGVYATWFSHGFYINGAIYGGHNNYDSGRAGLGGLANGSTEGSEWSTFIGGGYDFHLAQLTVGPIASLQYTDVGIDSFDEKGSLAPLNIHSGSAESLRSDVGFRAFYQWQLGKLVLEPSLKAAWEHEYKYSALPVTAGFAGIPGPSATFFGPSEGQDSAVVSAGVSVQVTPAITTYVNYDGQLGRGNYDSNAVTGGVRISF